MELPLSLFVDWGGMRHGELFPSLLCIYDFQDLRHAEFCNYLSTIAIDLKLGPLINLPNSRGAGTAIEAAA